MNWANDWLLAIEEAKSADVVFVNLEAAVRDLGFEYCAYGLRIPVPLSRPKTVMKSNYPTPWQLRYQEAEYLRTDPTVAGGVRSLVPMIWSDDMFADTPALWSEARSAGLRVGWAQSSLGSHSLRGMLTLARSSEAITTAELKANEIKMRWLASTAHQAFSRIFVTDHPEIGSMALSDREIEILKWSADGKTSWEVSEILEISVNTVNFHVKNSLAKLQVPNKMAAVVRAAMLGLLSH